MSNRSYFPLKQGDGTPKGLGENVVQAPEEDGNRATLKTGELPQTGQRANVQNCRFTDWWRKNRLEPRDKTAPEVKKRRAMARSWGNSVTGYFGVGQATGKKRKR